MRSGHRYGCGACPAPHCVLWRMPSTAYCFTLTVCCVWHVSLQGETSKKAQPADQQNHWPAVLVGRWWRSGRAKHGAYVWYFGRIDIWA